MDVEPVWRKPGRTSAILQDNPPSDEGACGTTLAYVDPLWPEAERSNRFLRRHPELFDGRRLFDRLLNIKYYNV